MSRSIVDGKKKKGKIISSTYSVYFTEAMAPVYTIDFCPSLCFKSASPPLSTHSDPVKIHFSFFPNHYPSLSHTQYFTNMFFLPVIPSYHRNMCKFHGATSTTTKPSLISSSPNYSPPPKHLFVPPQQHSTSSTIYKLWVCISSSVRTGNQLDLLVLFETLEELPDLAAPGFLNYKTSQTA